jgi:hypothetical protein
MEGHRAPSLVNNAIRCQLAQPGADVARSCAKSHCNVFCSQPVRAAAQNLNDPDWEITHWLSPKVEDFIKMIKLLSRQAYLR